MSLPLPDDLPSLNLPPPARSGQRGSACSHQGWARSRGATRSPCANLTPSDGARGTVYKQRQIFAAVYTQRGCRDASLRGREDRIPSDPPGPNASSLRRAVPLCGARSPPEAAGSSGEGARRGTRPRTAQCPLPAAPDPSPSLPRDAEGSSFPRRCGRGCAHGGAAIGCHPTERPVFLCSEPSTRGGCGDGMTVAPSGSLSLHPPRPPAPQDALG